MGGFAVFALGISLMINADLGLDPWSAFHMGLSLALPLSYGMASAGAGLILLGIGAGFFSQKLDWGTVLNMLLIGFMVDVIRPLLPPLAEAAPAFRWLVFLSGIGLAGLATGMYISSGWGAGPRDGFVLAVSARTRFSVRVILTAIQLSVLGAGALMRARVGWRTHAFPPLSGPPTRASLGLLRHMPVTRNPA